MSAAWKTTQFQFSGQGNSCHLLECSCENKQMFLFHSKPLPLFVLMQKPVAAQSDRRVNQLYVHSRLEAVNSGLGSAVFQPLSRNMC